MPEVLSQNQIDALLKSMSTGEVSKESLEEDSKNKVLDYDFFSPKKFTKEQLRSMENLHENLSRVLSSYFSGLLRVFSEVSVLQVEEQRYYEYNNALPDTALLGILELQPKDHNINESTLMMDISPNIAFFMIDRLLGGSGEGFNVMRDFTDIELSIMKTICGKLVTYMKDVWCDYLDVDIQLSSLETNPRLIQVYAPEDIVVIVVLNVKLKDMEGSISISIPAIGLEEMLREFTSKYARMARKLSDERRDKLCKQIIKDSVYDSDLEVEAIFDETHLELSDIMALKVDDVISLEKHVGEYVKLTVDDVPWFVGKLGAVKNAKAVKIMDVYNRN